VTDAGQDTIDVIQQHGGTAMTMVSVFGSTGFLGRQVVRRLAANGATVRIADGWQTLDC
jgi:NAD(P)-dependent dehydrogenase (short-subunit alcohol dehydrogenase family)